MRLNTFIARSGVCSRRKADCLIKEGKVRVNNKIIREPWYNVKSNDRVEIDNSLITPKNFVYMIFYKPKGVITTLKDRFASRTIRDYLPSYLKGIYPVGRLDKNSQGLLILTNDGNLCYRISHPRFRVEKEYEVEVKGNVSLNDIKQAKEGFLESNELLKVDRISIEKRNKDTTRLRVVTHQGKKRQIRRIFMHLGFKVIYLKRIRVANLLLGNLKPGEFRILKKEEVAKKVGVDI